MAAGDVIVISEAAEGRKGNYFDGVDDYVLHDAHAVARVAANDTVGTYTAWIYMDTVDGTERTILSAGDNTSTNEFLQLAVRENGRLKVALNHSGVGQFEIKSQSGSIIAREWTHVAIVQDGVQPVLYINGIKVAQSNSVSTDLTFWYDELTLVDKFAIGVREGNNTHILDFKGAIGQVKYFNIALTAEEMLIEAKGETHVTRASVIETARVFDITMDRDGTTDSGSGADNGTLTGDAHYGGYISKFSQAVEDNSTGHAAEFINTFIDGSKYVSVIKRGD